MDLALLAGLLRARSELRAHDRWSRDELLAHQSQAVRDLRAWALARSPFYREFHRGLEDAPLERLPAVTKQILMDRFDQVVTDRQIRRTDVESYLPRAVATGRFRGRYRVAATGGTTGRRGLFLADPREWATVLASYARAYDWAGLQVGPTNRVRMAVVSSTNPFHQSSMVGATVANPFVPTLRLDAAEPIGHLVAALRTFQPTALVGYASILADLAAEQAAGRLAIQPRAIFSASEVLTPETRARLRAAFGVEPTNVYAATETAGIASECRRGRMHRYEDLVIAEVVDEDNRPVPSGEQRARLLVTVLFSRTQPLIRYELSDRVGLADGMCPDGLPFGLLQGIEGREEEVLTIGGIRVHPNVFHAAIGGLDIAAWQVVESEGRLRVLLVRQSADLGPDEVAARVRAELRKVGVPDRSVEVHTEVVVAIPRTALGKAPLIRRELPRASGPGDNTPGEYQPQPTTEQDGGTSHGRASDHRAG